jgi:hypothetical protein
VAETDNQMTDAVRMYIIQALASFDTPSMVAEAVKDEFGVTISRQGVHQYDPTKAAGKDLKGEWRALFEDSRKAFLDNVTDIPIANKATRVRALNRMASKAEAMKNYKLAADLHKQAAEEMGNAYTNRRELTGKDGKDLPAPIGTAVAIFALPDNGRDA